MSDSDCEQRLIGVAATLLVVALGSAAVALVVVDDHHSTSIRITQLAVAGALVIVALGGFARVATAESFGHRRWGRERRRGRGGDVQLNADGAGRPVGLWVRLTGEGQRPFLVVSAERDNANFLVARDDEQAQWVPKDRIDSWTVGPGD